MKKSELTVSLLYHHEAFRQALVHMRDSQTCYADADTWTRRIEALDKMKSDALEIKSKDELNIWHMMTAVSFFASIVSLALQFHFGSALLLLTSFCFAHLADLNYRS